MSLSFGDLWGQMGMLARVVVVVLLVMSIHSVTIAVERLIAYQRARRQSRAFARSAARLLEHDRLAETIADARTHAHSHLAVVVSATLVEFEKKRRLRHLALDEVLESARRAGERATLLVTAELKRGTSALATVGATAPFVGLFGTVVGIVNAFAEMSRLGHGGIDAVAGGIAEALVTTALGLLVALPAVWTYNGLMHGIERFQVEMANASSELLDRLIERDLERVPVAGR